MNRDLEIWDNAAKNWNQLAQSGNLRTILSDQALEGLVGSVSGQKVLDAGCGNGYYTSWLAQKGAFPVGAEGSGEMVSIAKKNYPKLNFIQADLTKAMPFDAGAF